MARTPEVGRINRRTVETGAERVVASTLVRVSLSVASGTKRADVRQDQGKVGTFAARDNVVNTRLAWSRYR